MNPEITLPVWLGALVLLLIFDRDTVRAIFTATVLGGLLVVGHALCGLFELLFY